MKTRIALLGDSSIQLLGKVISDNNKDVEIYEGEYDSVDTEILDRTSSLHKFRPEIIVILESYFTFRDRYYSDLAKETFSERKVERMRQLLAHLSCDLPDCVVLCPMLYEFEDSIHGLHAFISKRSVTKQVRDYNSGLITLSSKSDSFLTMSLQGSPEVQSNIRKSIYYTANVHFNLQVFYRIAKRLDSLIRAIRSNIVKCVVVDLDNTLWGGVVGDDGPLGVAVGRDGEGRPFSDFQKWLLEAKREGIILAVCSKNDEQIAKDVFEVNKGMELKLGDFAAFSANWENKADNIKVIRDTLEIGLDSIVFLDDNPAERDLVRQRLPEVIVPELPDDAAEFVEYLSGLQLFSKRSLKESVVDRTQMYQSEFERRKLSAQFSSISDFLVSLEMRAECSRIRAEDVERIAELSQRSNQFNLRTVRYTNDQLLNIIDDKSFACFKIGLVDRFGDYGIVGVSVVRIESEWDAFLDNLFMSCRVLRRGVEKVLLNSVVQDLQGIGIRRLRGEYIPTKKNGLVKDFLKEHGFSEEEGGKWNLDLDSHSFFETQIKLMTAF